MPTINDSEFGDIIVRRHAWSKGFRATVKPNGKLHISVPQVMPQFMIKRHINATRSHLRKFIAENSKPAYKDGDPIGKTHRLHVRKGQRFSIAVSGSQLIVTLGADDILTTKVQNALRTHAQKILRKEARGYLPGRLSMLAQHNNLSYKTVRLSHAGTRWGSCSSTGTISLNIGLMNLPYELIDYVLLHELAHTKHMNHSKSFWELVATMDMSYVRHRKLLKNFSPAI